MTKRDVEHWLFDEVWPLFSDDERTDEDICYFWGLVNGNVGGMHIYDRIFFVNSPAYKRYLDAFDMGFEDGKSLADD